MLSSTFFFFHSSLTIAIAPPRASASLMYHWHLSEQEAQEEYLCLFPAGVTDDFFSFKVFFFLLSSFLGGVCHPKKASMLWVGMYCWDKLGVGGNVLSLRQGCLKPCCRQWASTGGTDAGVDQMQHRLTLVPQQGSGYSTARGKWTSYGCEGPIQTRYPGAYGLLFAACVSARSPCSPASSAPRWGKNEGTSLKNKHRTSSHLSWGP